MSEAEHGSDLTGRVVLITGANSGIGKETAAGLAAEGATVVVTARDAAKGEAAAAEIRERVPGAEVELEDLDLASFDSIRSMAGRVLDRHEQLHVLVNNAGLVLRHRSETAEGFETTFGVNHLGHFLLTDLLIERLEASAPSRVVNVSSEAHKMAMGGLDFADLQSERRYRGMQVYGQSKLANLYFTFELARRLEGTGVTANAVHPGMVATRFGRDGDTGRLGGRAIALLRPFMRSPAQGAATSIWAASAPELESVTGRYFERCRPAKPSRTASDERAARRLWEVSERLVAEA